ncbi:hypothetical protein RND81_09G029600 [Saponaria officinalis]|uniref:Uncharacterized protein n=1 Tax=Saponaria officinalis TaxID=3572 RepID=A0AAW1IHG0_SAPOF
MASSSTSLFFKSSSNNNNNNQPPLRATTTQPDPKPDPTPKPRTRRGNRAQKGPTKPPRRGMGVERIELELQRRDGSSPTNRILAAKMTANNNNNPTHTGPTLPGFPVHQYPIPVTPYYFPGQPDLSPLRPVPVELPSMPNLVLKKKRVNGEEENHEGVLVGFGKNVDYGVIFGGFNANNSININNGDYFHHFGVNNGAFPVYYDFTTTTSDQVMTTHRKWSKSTVMEYGFFPENSDTTIVDENIKDYNQNTNNTKNNINNNNNYYYYKKTDYLDLKLGYSETSYASSPSSSLTTATTTTAGVSDTTLDLSLKLSNY